MASALPEYVSSAFARYAAVCTEKRGACQRLRRDEHGRARSLKKSGKEH